MTTLVHTESREIVETTPPQTLADLVRINAAIDRLHDALNPRTLAELIELRDLTRRVRAGDLLPEFDPADVAGGTA